MYDFDVNAFAQMYYAILYVDDNTMIGIDGVEEPNRKLSLVYPPITK